MACQPYRIDNQKNFPIEQVTWYRFSDEQSEQQRLMIFTEK